MKRLFKLIFKTNNADISALVGRLTMAVVILPHGLQKTLGLFGGYGFSGTVGFFTDTLGLPLVIAVLVIAAESLGALAIGIGFMTRFCSASLAIIMIGAIIMGHWEHGLFMNWFGQQQGEGFEYHLLVIGLALMLVVSGGGKLSLDQKLSERL